MRTGVLGPRRGLVPNGNEPAWPDSGSAADRPGARLRGRALGPRRARHVPTGRRLGLSRPPSDAASGHGDEFAQQTVLQVLLPSLLDLSRRACAKATRTCRGWVDEDELEQQVVVIAFERIRALAGTTQAWPARTLLDETWRRLRTVHEHEHEQRHRAVCQPVAPLVEIPSGADRSAAEHLAQQVVDAVRDGRLDRGPGQLFYATRILGERPDAVGTGRRTQPKDIRPYPYPSDRSRSRETARIYRWLGRHRQGFVIKL